MPLSSLRSKTTRKSAGTGSNPTQSTFVFLQSANYHIRTFYLHILSVFQVTGYRDHSAKGSSAKSIWTSGDEFDSSRQQQKKNRGLKICKNQLLSFNFELDAKEETMIVQLYYQT